MTTVRAHYRIPAVLSDVVFLIDLDGPVSITNDAEAVVREVHERFPGKAIIYRDTAGDWGELVHVHGHFAGFLPYSGVTPISART